MDDEDLIYDFGAGNALEIYLFERYKIHEIIKDETKAIVVYKNRYDEKDEVYISYKVIDKEVVYEKIKNGEEVDISGCYINNFRITDIDNYESIPIVNFNASYSFWDGGVNFTNAVFRGEKVNFSHAGFSDSGTGFKQVDFGQCVVDFTYVKFGDGRTSFQGSVFGDKLVDFSNAIFGIDGITFNNTRFGEGKINFFESRFNNSSISFKQAQLGNGGINLSKIKIINGKVDFSYCGFGRGGVNFNFSEFINSDIRFDFAKLMTSNMYFNFAVFKNSDIGFNFCSMSNGEIDFRKSTFNDSNIVINNLTLENSKTHIEEVTYNGGDIIISNVDARNLLIDLSGAEPTSLCLRGLTIDENIKLNLKNIDTLLIQNCVIKTVLKLEKKWGEDEFFEYKGLSFKDVTNFGHIYLDWVENNVQQAIYNYAKNEYYNKMQIQAEQNEFDINKNPRHIKKKLPEKELKIIGEQYRMLKENFSSIGKEEDATLAFVAYKNCDISITHRIFYYVGKYGTQRYSIIITQLLTIIMFTGLHLLLFNDIFIDGANDLLLKRVEKSFYFSVFNFFNMQCRDDLMYNALVDILSVTEGIVGLFMIVYLINVTLKKILK